jgi:PAS domain S-box-containing protein
MKRSLRFVLRYAVAVAAVILALAVKELFSPLTHGWESSPFVLFSAAVLVAAWCGGLDAGLVATGLSALVVKLYLRAEEPAASLLLFILEGWLITILTDALHRARSQALSLGRLRDILLGREQTAEQRYRNLVHGLDAIVWEAQAEPWRFTFVSPGAEAMLGYPAERWLAEPDFLIGLIHPEDRARVSHCLQAAARGVDQDLEFRAVGARGQQLWLRCLVYPAVQAVAEPALIGGLIVDATERRRAEEELRRSEEQVRRLAEVLEQRVQERTVQLQEANRELEAFSYSVSHDLRAPLRHISGFVDLLRKHAAPALDETARRYLNVIGEAVRYAGQLVDDLLSFSRMGRTELCQSRIDMGELVASVRSDLEEESEREVVWHLSELPEVCGDAAMLRLVVHNLLSNALKFTRGRAPAEIGVDATAEGPVVAFRVWDNGVGFDMKYAGKLFNVFQRLHPREQVEGTGIGLANVRRIIQRHGGRTWAEGSPGAGAAFYFTLPAAPHQVAAPGAAVEESETPPSLGEPTTQEASACRT